MPNLVTDGTMLQCSFGTTPSSLVVPPTNRTTAGGRGSANILDHQPMGNIQPFGMCSSMANPQVAAATAAAQGVLTPQPCMPATMSPWVPGVPTTTIGGQPAVDDSCQCLCNWAGTITVVSTSQVTVQT